jgi:hypothetical protein
MGKYQLQKKNKHSAISNPFDEATIIAVRVNQAQDVKTAFISIRDLQGKEIERLPIDLSAEINEVIYHHGYGQIGTYAYTLVVDGVDKGSKMMVFAN